MSLGSIFGKIGKGALNIGTGGLSGTLGDIFGAGGAGLGGYASDSAKNRDAQFSGQMDLAKLLNDREMERQRLGANADNDYTSNQIARSQEGRASLQDAWRKLQSAQHVTNPGARPQLAGPYNVAPRQASGAEQQGADAMTQEVMARLQGGNPIAPVDKRSVNLGYDPMSTVDPKLLKTPGGERLSGILGPLFSFLGRPKPQQDENI